MQKFWELIIKPFFEICGIKTIAEVGCDMGLNTIKPRQTHEKVSC